MRSCSCSPTDALAWAWMQFVAEPDVPGSWFDARWDRTASRQIRTSLPMPDDASRVIPILGVSSVAGSSVSQFPGDSPNHTPHSQPTITSPPSHPPRSAPAQAPPGSTLLWHRDQSSRRTDRCVISRIHLPHQVSWKSPRVGSVKISQFDVSLDHFLNCSCMVPCTCPYAGRIDVDP